MWLVVTAVLLFYFLALNSVLGDSPTMDEQNHLARGLAFLRTGDPRLSLEHPPLINSLSALPLLTMPEIRLPTDDVSWLRVPPDVYWYIFAERLLWEVNRDLDIGRIIFLARLPIIYLTVGLALVGYRFGRALWRRRAGLFVFLFLLFDPNVLAHGRYTTTDLGGTLFILLATFALWRLWRSPAWSWGRWLAAAVALGLAFASKLSALAFVPIWLLLAVLPLYGRSGRRAAGRRALHFLTAGLASILVIWALFGFEWGHFVFLDSRLATLNRLQGPMPTFWGGIERIALLSGGGRPSFLLGQFSSEGFLLYFPIAFLVKTPLLVLLLLPIAAALLLWLRPTRARALFLLLPVLLYFALSTQSALNLGYRHLLPILPFIYLLIAGLASQPVAAWAQGATNKMTFGAQIVGRFSKSPGDLENRPTPSRQVVGEPWARVAGYVLAAAVLAQILVTLRIHPYYLSYFNVAAGGPANGYNVLIDSNVDWGQDLLRLRAWMAAHDVAQIKLGWFGTADPAYYGIDYEPLPGFPRQPFLSQWTYPPFDPTAPAPGVYAISASALWELPLAEKNVYPWFRARPPDDRVGYSILIYEVP